MGTAEATRSFQPASECWRHAAFPGGTFDTAIRRYTAAVDGNICSPDPLLLVTLRGGAKRLDVRTDCGHRYSGPERIGAVSFVPAGCMRSLTLRGVESEWASITLDRRALTRFDPAIATLELAPFSNLEDPFVSGLLHELERLLTVDGALDPAYCEIMAGSLATYLARRYQRPWLREVRTYKLSPLSLRRIREYIDAHLERPILMSELAALIGVSTGHLHRAFRKTTGVTPLRFVQQRRVERASELLLATHASITELALRTGFLSTSHFTRTFREVTGVNPSRYRADRRLG